MALNTRDILLVIRARDVATRTIRQVGNELNTLDGDGRKAAQGLMGTASALTAAGAAMMGIGALGISQVGGWISASAQFSTQMARVQTQLDTFSATNEELRNIVRRTATEVPSEFEQMGDTLFFIFGSTNANLEEGAELLRQYSKEAVAGNSSVEAAARSSIAIMNAFGLTVQDSARIADMQFQTVRKGIISYEELSNVIGRTIPAAVASGQSIETVGAMMAFLTRNGLSAAMASTSAARAMELLSMPHVTKNLEEYGVAVRGSNGEFLQMHEIITQLAENKGWAQMTDPERKAAFTDIFGRGSIQARRFFDVAIPNYKELNQHMAWQLDKVGVFEEAYDIMFNSPQAQIQLLKNQMSVLKTELGDQLLPLFMEGVGKVQELVAWFSNLDSGTKAVIVQVVALTSAGLALAGAVLTLTGLALGFIAMLTMVGVKVGAATLMFGGLTAALVALPAILFLLYTHWDSVRGIIVTLMPLIAALGVLLVTHLYQSISAQILPMLVRLSTAITLQVIPAIMRFFATLAAGNVAGMVTALRSLTTGMTGAMGAAALAGAAFMLWDRRMQQAKESAEEFGNEIRGYYDDAESLDALNAKIAATHEGVAQLRRDAEQSINPLDADYRRELQMGAEELEKVAAEGQALADTASRLQSELGLTGEEALVLARKAQELGLETGSANSQWEEFKDSLTGTDLENIQSAMGLTAEELALLTDGIGVATVEIGRWGVALDENGVAITEWEGELGAALDTAADHFWDFSDDAKESLSTWMTEAEDQLGKFSRWQDNLIIIAERGGTDLALEWAKMGPEFAGVVEELTTTSDEEFNRMAGIMQQRMAQGSRDMVTELRNAAGPTQTALDGVEAVMNAEFDAWRRTFPAAASDVGSKIGDGISSGIRKNQNAHMNDMTNYVNSLLRRAEQAAGIHSPSKLFADRVGLPIGQGIAVGLLDAKDAVDKATLSLIEPPTLELPPVNIDSAGAASSRESQSTSTEIVAAIERLMQLLMTRDGVTIVVPDKATGDHIQRDAGEEVVQDARILG